MPAGLAPRVALFHGVGGLWCGLLLAWEGRLAAIAALAARPWAGLLQGVLGFAALAGSATLLLRLPSGALPSWLPGLLHPLDISPLYDDPRFPVQPGGLLRLVLVMGGGMLEEWIFRCALWLRWSGGLRWAGAGPARPLPPYEGKSASAGWRGNPSPLEHGWKLLGVSAYFALLHWPQGAAAMLQAFAGSLVLGALLWWRRNFWLIATLHALFNWTSV